MQRQPLAEVFGHLPTDFSPKAVRYRKNKLCPFNEVPSCTKDKAMDPLGVCSIHNKESTVITCPIRFREEWLVVDDAADFFFPEGATWTSLTEVRLADFDGRSAGNIDVVLVAYDGDGRVYDFGSLEIQAVDISENVRESFTHYMSDCEADASMDWVVNQPSHPHPDFLSLFQENLAPHLMFRGSILHTWNKKMAVALDSTFFRTLPDLQEVPKEDANIAWLVYDLVPSLSNSRYTLRKTKTVYTRFAEALRARARPTAGSVDDFMKALQAEIDKDIEFPP